MSGTAVHSVVAREGELRFSVEIGGGTRSVRYAIEPPITPNPDAALPAVLVPAMTRGAPLTLEPPIDPGLLRNLPDLQAIFSAWAEDWPYPRGDPGAIEVEAAPAPPQRGDGRAVAAFFSGGVDSFATVLSHPEITHLVFVRGVDLAPERRRLADRVAERLEHAAGLLGKSWIAVETDARRLGDEFVPWVGYFGQLLASVARLLSPAVERIYVASESTYRHLYRRGSHPLIDHLWGGDAIRVVHDGARFGRAEKVERIADSEVARRTLRVCWENRDDDYNCCRCEKCLRTMVALAALGVLDRFETFDRPLELDAVAAVVPGKEIERDFWAENLELGRRHGAAPALLDAIRSALGNAAPGPEQRLLALERELGDRDAELERVVGSASWRLTAPLRRAKSLLDGERGRR